MMQKYMMNRDGIPFLPRRGNVAMMVGEEGENILSVTKTSDGRIAVPLFPGEKLSPELVGCLVKAWGDAGHSLQDADVVLVNGGPVMGLAILELGIPPLTQVKQFPFEAPPP